VRSLTGWIKPSEPIGPIVLEGLNPPELLEDLLRRTPPQADGYSSRVIVIQEDASELAAGLARADLSAALTDPRVTVLVGPGASGKLRDALSRPESAEGSLPGRVIRSPRLNTPADPPVEQVLSECHRAQQGEHARLRQRVLAAGAGRDRARWAARFEQACAPGSSSPLRVLIPTSRYTTFLRHSAEDLADAFRAGGHAAEVLMEPDDHTRLTSPAYLRAFDRLDPDLVVLINYTRRHMGEAVPPSVPFVCWVQDRMGHLFDASGGVAQGDLDFLFGHLHIDLFTHFGYPARNRLFSFVPASSRKFHDGPVSPALLERHRCDIAYVSHQSETPERFHQRVAPMFESIPAVRASLDAIGAGAAARLAALDAGSPLPPRVDMVRAALAEAGIRNPDERLVMTVDGQYAVPLLERMHRHRTLGWVAEIARRRGWRFNLYGRGWDRHPHFAEFARGELAHDHDGLRALYRSAGVNLHISLNSNAHQRVYECALSGGLMLRRGPSPDWETVKASLMRLAAERPPVSTAADGSTLHELDSADGIGAQAYFEMRSLAPSHDDQGRVVYRRWLTPESRRSVLRLPAAPPGMFPDLAFPSASESLFCTPAALEAAIERTLNDAPWRQRTIDAHRRAALRYCTYDTAAVSLLKMVRTSLRGEVVS